MKNYDVGTNIRILFVKQEKGTTPLHIAAKAGQVSQAELLVVYGSDPGAEDSKGKTPIDYARCDLDLLSN
jgi:ankyrin repeat protein